MANNIKNNATGYGYKYTDLAEVHNYLEQIGASYYQYTETDEHGNDYIFTVPIIGGEEKPARRGCRIVQATLSGKSNPAQEQGSAVTYARRYSLLMAFGLATTDDDAQIMTREKGQKGKTIKARTDYTKIERAEPAEPEEDLYKGLIVAAARAGYTNEDVCRLLRVQNIAELSDERLRKGIEYFNLEAEDKGDKEE